MISPATTYRRRLETARTQAHRSADAIIAELEDRARAALLTDEHQRIYEEARALRAAIEEGR